MIVTLNGRPNGIIRNPDRVDDDNQQTIVTHGNPRRRVPISINGQVQTGVTINGYEYPPCESGCVLYLPGLPGYGSTIWDRSNQDNHGTITGATWTRLPSGLWVLNFDGNDDYVEKTEANWRSSDGLGTILMWINTPVTGAEQCLFASSDTGTNTSYLECRIRAATDRLQMATQDAGGTLNAVQGAEAIADGTWHLVGVQSNGTAWSLYRDGVSENIFGIVGANIGDWFGDITLRDNFSIGVRHNTGLVNDFTGKIALPRVLNIALSDSEWENIYQRERYLFGV